MVYELTIIVDVNDVGPIDTYNTENMVATDGHDATGERLLAAAMHAIRGVSTWEGDVNPYAGSVHHLREP